MNRKQLTFLIALGVVLGGLGWLAYQKRQAPYQESASKMGGKLLPNFPLNDVAHLSIKDGKAELNLVRKDDQWTVRERGDYPANFNNLSDLLRKIWELKIAKPVKVGPSRLPQLELAGPDKGSGTLVSFKDASGKPIASLLLGAKHMKQGREDSPFGGGSFPDGRYVMVGSDAQSVALISDPLNNAEPKPEDWLNKDFFKVENLKSIAVTSTNATNNWKLSRDSETNEWKLADVKAGETLDTGKSGGAITALSAPSFHDVVMGAKPEDTGLDKPLTAVLETFEGFTYTAKVGKAAADDNYHFQIAVSADLKKERVPGKDEKPEDKTRLDKEFADKLKSRQDKLKTEQGYGKWSYLVTKWTIDPLLKERKDLLAEKKEEPKAESKPVEFTPDPLKPPSP